MSACSGWWNWSMTCGSGLPNWRANSRNCAAFSCRFLNTRICPAKNASQTSRKSGLIASASSPKPPSFVSRIRAPREVASCARRRAGRVSCFQPRHIEPLFPLPAPPAQLRELHASRALEQVPAEGAFAGDVLEKELPLHLEGVVVAGVGRFLPALEEIDRLRDIRVPHQLGSFFIRLNQTTA